jgi:hypothetical protein
MFTENALPYFLFDLELVPFFYLFSLSPTSAEDAEPEPPEELPLWQDEEMLECC